MKFKAKMKMKAWKKNLLSIFERPNEEIARRYGGEEIEITDWDAGKPMGRIKKQERSFKNLLLNVRDKLFSREYVTVKVMSLPFGDDGQLGYFMGNERRYSFKYLFVNIANRVGRYIPGYTMWRLKKSLEKPPEIEVRRVDEQGSDAQRTS